MQDDLSTSPLFYADINECLNNPCTGPTSTCENSEGSYSCSCGQGYTLSGDECIGMFQLRSNISPFIFYHFMRLFTLFIYDLFP